MRRRTGWKKGLIGSFPTQLVRRRATRDAQSKRLVDGLAFDFTAAKRAGFNGQGAETLAIIKGISPEIAAQMY